MTIKIEEHTMTETSGRYSSGSYSIERHDYIMDYCYDGEVDTICGFLEDKVCGKLATTARLHGGLVYYETNVVRSPEGNTVFYLELLANDDLFMVFSISISVE